MEHKLTEAQEAWLQALESGEYERGTSALARLDRNTNKFHYCCLGVGCEVAIVKGVELKVEESEGATYKWRKVFGGEASFAPKKVQEFLGLNCQEGRFVDQTKVDLNKHLFGDTHIVVPQARMLVRYQPDATIKGFRVYSLAQLNDASDYTFPEIAKIIRENAALVFKPQEVKA
jgi:hypothetical protein